MKILVVTSEVTFVPDNYNQFLEGLFRELKSEKELDVSLVILRNNSITLTLKGLLLMLSGARHIGFHLLKNSFKARLKDRKHIGVPIYYFNDPNSPAFFKFVKDHKIDLLINARTRFIYNNEILKLPTMGAINIHHGLLPDYRGTMCDLWALYENRPTGFSIHLMERKIDTGPIIRRVYTTSPKNSNNRKNFADLIFESSKREGVEMVKIIKNIKKDQSILIEKENISSSATYTKIPNFFTIRKMLKKGIEL